MITIVGLVFALALFPAYRTDDPVEFPKDLDRWFVTVAPKDDQLLLAETDIVHEWVVSSGGGKVRVGLVSDRQGARSSLPFDISKDRSNRIFTARQISTKVADGWVVCFNHGEFGAELWWFSEDGQKRYRLSDRSWVVGFFPSKLGLFALEGLSHGSISRGKVSRVFQDKNGRWSIEKWVDLEDGAEVGVQTSDETIVIATTNQLVSVSLKDKSSDVMIDHAFWDGLFPNSIIAVAPDRFFIGMRHGVALIKKGKPGYDISWLLPDQAFAGRKYVPGFH